MAEVSRGRKLSWADAAQSAGYGFSSRSTGLGLTGLLFRTGEQTQMTGVVDALGAANPFIAGTITGHYATGGAIPRVVTSSFVAIPLSRQLPSVVLLARGLEVLTLAGVGTDSSPRLSLEGNFDRTFTLYCPEGHERDALEIFSPPFMEQLVTATGGCDVELVGDWMFVYGQPGRFRSDAALAAVEDAAALVQATVRRQTSRYAEERTDTRPTSTVALDRREADSAVGTPGEQATHTPVQRVTAAVLAVLLVVAVGLYVVWAMSVG